MSYHGDRLHPWLRSLLLPPEETPPRHPLTAARPLIYCGGRLRMNPWPMLTEPRGSSSRRKAFFCLVLALFLLYNPFMALLHSCGQISVQHPARNRATVGASELQHFSPVSSQSTAEVSALEETFAISPRAIKGQYQPAVLLVLPRIASTAFSSNLWFRPPPSL